MKSAHDIIIRPIITEASMANLKEIETFSSDLKEEIARAKYINKKMRDLVQKQI